MTEFIIANDIGTTRIKSLCVYKSRPGTSYRFEVESILGETKELLSEDTKLMVITTAEGEWFIGPSAVRYSRNLIKGRDKRWPFTPQYRALHLFSIAQHISPTSTNADVDLVSAIPFSDRRNKEKIAQTLLGTHIIQVDNRSIKISINNIYFGIQGVSALMADGVKNGETVGWLGLGGRNKTYATISENKIITDKTGSTEGGMLTAIDAFIDMVKDKTDLHLTESEAILAINSGQVKASGETVDVKDFAMEALTPYCDAVYDLIGSVWTVDYMPRISDFRIGGGGALGIGDAIASQYRQARVVSDPRWTEAQGLLNLGIGRYGT